MPKSMPPGMRPLPAHIAVYIFVIVAFLAPVAAVPVSWGWGLAWDGASPGDGPRLGMGLTWLDLVLPVFSIVTCPGVRERPQRQRCQGRWGEEPAPARVLRQKPQREYEALHGPEVQRPGGQRERQAVPGHAAHGRQRW
jgi:hypothetical protein